MKTLIYQSTPDRQLSSLLRLTCKRKARPERWLVLMIVSSLAASSPRAASDPAKEQQTDVMEMDLEALMKMEVTSVSRKSEPLSNAAAAIFVITQEDIRRSGVTSIPEALRLSPGLEVARQDAHTWAISSRGFNDEFANQLLVLVDGRSVYTPLFAGVYWNLQDLVLEDIDRIEVIRGPGGTLWGANAVNGVINITTKSARTTQGLLVTTGAGTEERGFGTIRYGGKISENSYYRVFAKYLNRDESSLRDGSEANDSWWMSRGGIRYDWIPDDRRHFTLQGEAYGGAMDQTAVFSDVTSPGTGYQRLITSGADVSGGHLLSRWSLVFSEDSDLTAKIYYDYSDLERLGTGERRHTIDADIQHRYQVGERNDVVWGVGYNITQDSLQNNLGISFDPLERSLSLYSAFVQDEIALIPDRLSLTVGSKIEHNDMTGWEFQPSGRLSLQVTENQTTWFAASRAISTPSRAEEDVRINQSVLPPGTALNPAPIPVLVSLFGSRDVDSKELIAFELGYRIRPLQRLSLDIATFYNLYDKQRSVQAGPLDASQAPQYLTAPYTIANMVNGETYGVEVAATWQPTEWWRFRANYTFWRIALHRQESSTDFQVEGAEGDSPRHQAAVRSLMDLPHNLEFDLGFRYVDELSERRRFVDPGNTSIPSYFVGDARIGWRPNYNWELSLVGQNLIEARHQEFAPSYILTHETFVESSIYGKVTYRF